MALPASGAISLANVNTELGAAAGTARSLNDAAVRTLFGKASGAIAMSDGYGKSAGYTFAGNISANTNNYNLRNAAIAAGWDGVTAIKATVTINAGVVVGSASTGTPAFATGSSFPAGSTLTLVNNGAIVGKGGTGGNSTSVYNGAAAAGSAGGTAFSATAAITVSNYGTIGGGGGGGGGGGPLYDVIGMECGCGGGPPICIEIFAEGGGGGGGAGYGAASTGTYAGSAGGATSGGAGGSGGGIVGGTGGALGSSGSAGGAGKRQSCERNYLGSNGSAGGGGGAGSCTAGNANITWSVAGTRYGPLN